MGEFLNMIASRSELSPGGDEMVVVFVERCRRLNAAPRSQTGSRWFDRFCGCRPPRNLMICLTRRAPKGVFRERRRVRGVDSA